MAKEIKLLGLRSEIIDELSGPSRFEITSYPTDFSLSVLRDMYEAEDLVVPQTFQRRYVWSNRQASRLIESFLLGLPVPEIFLYREKASQKLLVIDGQQRLKSLYHFLSGTFEDGTEFRLRDIQPKWSGKTFSELSEPDRRKLETSPLRAIIVAQQHPKDNTSIYHVFERLNTGGTKLKNQEIRNCLFRGPFSEMLKELNLNAEWRKILGSSDIDKRQRDIELMLRFFALLYSSKSYYKPMKDFLSEFMDRQNQSSKKWLRGSRQVFLSTTSFIYSSLGAKPFHARRGGLNAAVFDAVYVAVGRKAPKRPSSSFERRYRSILRNVEFVSFTSEATTDADTVRGRIALASRRLFT